MNRHPHRIILEGMDGSGKSRLAADLAYAFPNARVYQALGATANLNARLPEILDEEADGTVPIHDRLFFSELVYGPVLRGEISLSQELMNNVAWFLRSTAFLVYVRPARETIAQYRMINPQMRGVLEHTDKLIDAYDKIMAVERTWFGPRFFHYNWRAPEDFQNLVQRLSEYLRA